MIVRKLSDIEGTERDIHSTNWNSRRLLLKKEGMGFSLHDTIIHAGTETHIWYRNHLEAVYCIEGEGSVEDLGTGLVHEIVAGTVYALDGNEEHMLRARTRMRMVCVFNPPITGAEVHDKDGVYPLITEEVPAAE